MNRKENCALKVLIMLAWLSWTFATPTTITAPPVSENVILNEKDDLKDFLGHCLHKKDVSKCLKARVIDVIDDVINSDEPLSVNFFNLNMSLNKNPIFQKEAENSVDSSRAFDDIISHKIKSLLESRVIQVKLADEKNSENPSSVNEARKKKGGGGGGKHTMMMSGEMSSRINFHLFELNVF